MAQVYVGSVGHMMNARVAQKQRANARAAAGAHGGGGVDSSPGSSVDDFTDGLVIIESTSDKDKAPARSGNGATRSDTTSHHSEEDGVEHKEKPPLPRAKTDDAVDIPPPTQMKRGRSDTSRESGTKSKLVTSMKAAYESMRQQWKKMSLSTKHEFTDDVVWILGTSYAAIHPNSRHIEQEREGRRRHICQDLYSRLWMTYRKEFPGLFGTKMCSDSGWGCMLRSGQMLMAQAFVLHFLGRTWRFNRERPPRGGYETILSWFLDFPDQRAPYSLHNLLKEGKVFGKKLGEWYGPHAVSHMLKKTHDKHVLHGIQLLLADNGVVYRDAAEQLASPQQAQDSDAKSPTAEHASVYPRLDKGAEKPWQPMIIIIPVRLGPEQINPGYVPALLECFQFPQSLGFMGGRARSAFYFVGYQGSRLLYLDPHTPQKSLPSNVDLAANSMSYHTDEVLSIPWDFLDPSLALGFYCKDRVAFEDFWARAAKISQCEFPVFSIAEKMPKLSRMLDEDGDTDAVDIAATVAASPELGPVTAPLPRARSVKLRTEPSTLKSAKSRKTKARRKSSLKAGDDVENANTRDSSPKSAVQQEEDDGATAPSVADSDAHHSADEVMDHDSDDDFLLL